ncbi:Lipoprotein-releasing system ATP-binding protein LolD [Novipirellula galeiformis]|uniref:Lipoprotein-releasing system ATP-binding protein LolD n=1 Tax=Novipirellula galeiformis TaxID=2528004 RepID=A0A5C6C702_9BACT|nr:ABC transporter ATP-binding protein [Novipirellula galeiformis]TWU20420.1 Lipoprotein-releasing system ATP-binding protein LolD [Novipirellula galeiformis]
MANVEKTLQITDLVKTFDQPGGGRLTVLDIPKFEINAGEQVALIGQSGGGKTTLLHLIAGLLTPDSGSIRLVGTELTKLSEQGRDRFRASTIGYVFQTFNLLPAFTAIENVRLGMTFGHGRMNPSRADELLARVGLADRAHYRPSQLSVGQQQRVAIARSLAGKPRLLLCDEPTANVDPVSAENVLDLIRSSCQEENVAMLMVTHSMDVAERFDRIEKLDQINQAFSATAH